MKDIANTACDSRKVFLEEVTSNKTILLDEYQLTRKRGEWKELWAETAQAMVCLGN